MPNKVWDVSVTVWYGVIIIIDIMIKNIIIINIIIINIIIINMITHE